MANRNNNIGYLKKMQEGNIPAKIILKNGPFFSRSIYKYFNDSLNKGEFPNYLKLVNITPVFKKDVCTSKNNYRPINILPFLSTISERLLKKQLLEFFEIIVSKFKCFFRKDYSAQHCLLMMLKKEAPDNNKAFGMLLTDLCY